MLNDIKKMYEEQASFIKNWKDIDKNELCRKYIEYENNSVLSAKYLSAIICRYWNKLQPLYENSKPAATEEDCYDWLVESILYTLKHRRWEDKDSSIYDDKNGPDKMINRVLKSRRLTFFQLLYKDKRQIRLNTTSLDWIQDEHYEGFIPPENLPTTEINLNNTSELVNEFFDKKDYFAAFLLDAIVNIDCFSWIDNSWEFDYHKLFKHLNHLDDKYALIFSDEHNIPLQTVLNSLKYMSIKSEKDMTRKIKRYLKQFKFNLKEDLLC